MMDFFSDKKKRLVYWFNISVLIFVSLTSNAVVEPPLVYVHEPDGKKIENGGTTSSSSVLFMIIGPYYGPGGPFVQCGLDGHPLTICHLTHNEQNLSPGKHSLTVVPLDRSTRRPLTEESTTFTFTVAGTPPANQNTPTTNLCGTGLTMDTITGECVRH